MLKRWIGAVAISALSTLGIAGITATPAAAAGNVTVGAFGTIMIATDAPGQGVTMVATGNYLVTSVPVTVPSGVPCTYLGPTWFGHVTQCTPSGGIYGWLLQGLDGNDSLFMSSPALSYMSLDGGDGNDMLEINAGGGSPSAFGRAGNDTINIKSYTGNANGDGGNDTFNVNAPGVKPTANGGGGDDVFNLSTSALAQGNEGRDTLNGSPQADELRGGIGADNIYARDGVKDQVYCGANSDGSNDGNDDHALIDGGLDVPHDCSNRDID